MRCISYILFHVMIVFRKLSNLFNYHNYGKTWGNFKQLNSRQLNKLYSLIIQIQLMIKIIMYILQDPVIMIQTRHQNSEL